MSAARRLLVCAAAWSAVLACVSPSGASTTRVGSLGGMPDILDDVINVYAYPSLVPQYANVGLADLGRVVAPETYGTLGNLTLTGRSIGGLVQYRGAPGIGVTGLVLGREAREQRAPDPVPSTGDGVEVLYGHRLGARGAFGARGYFAGAASASREIGRAGVSSREASLSALTLGAGYEVGRLSRLDLAFATASRSFTSDSTSALGTYALDTTHDGHAPWSTRARLEARVAPDLVVRAYAGYARDDFSARTVERQGATTRTLRRERPEWREEFGVGFMLEPADAYTLYLGAGYDRTHRHDRQFAGDSLVTDAPSSFSQSPVLVAGAEIRLWPWLAVRTAARKPYTVNERDSTNADPYCGCVPQHLRTIDFPTFFSLGAQFTVRALDLDVQLNERTPFVQGFFASGAPVVPVIGVSATFHFDDGARRPRRRTTTR